MTPSRDELVVAELHLSNDTTLARRSPQAFTETDNLLKDGAISSRQLQTSLRRAGVALQPLSAASVKQHLATFGP
jgi:hypothetical protein